MRIELRHLRLVECVAREGTLTAAAKRLFLTQSALSHQLADLERRVGGPVFERVGRRMVATPAGRRLLAAAADVLGSLRDLERDLADVVGGRTGQLRITAECFTCYHWLPDVLPAFRAEHPGVDVVLVPEAAPAPAAALLAGTVDLALSYDPPDDDRLEAEPLFTDEQVLLVAPGHPLAAREFVVAGDFADQHLLVYVDRPADSLFFRTILVPEGVRPARVSEVRLTEGIVALVAAGAGVAVLTRWTAAPDIVAGRVVAVPIGRFGLRREWRAIALRGEAVPPAYRTRFTELLRGGPARLFKDPERGEEMRAAGIVGPTTPSRRR